MNIVRRVTPLVLSLLLALGLASCGPSGPDMPMEVTVNGRTIVMGRTTTGEMAGWGWEVEFMSIPSEIRADAKYASCDYHITVDGGGQGREFRVSVYVPFRKNMVDNCVDLSAEAEESKTAGVVYRVSVRKSAGDGLSVTYNGVDLRDITWDTAAEWGAAMDEESYRKFAELAAAQGTLTFEAASGGSGALNELTVTMSDSVFSKLQT